MRSLTFSLSRRCTARPGSVVAALAALLVLGWSAPVAAQRGDAFEPEPGEPGLSAEPLWRESDAAVPRSAPAPEAMVPIRADLVAPGHRYLIDVDGLSRGRDGVIRYTVLIEGAGGGRSVFFEGLRCTPREFKVYAFADGRGMFRPYAGARWRRDKRHGLLGFREVLRQRYFCEGGEIPRTARDIRRQFGRLRVLGGGVADRTERGFAGDIEH